MTPEKIQRIAHYQTKLDKLMDIVPTIASCQLGEVIKESFPPKTAPIEGSERLR